MPNFNNTTRNITVLGSNGNDSIYNYARNVTVNAGGGSDTVTTYGNRVSLFGGDGSDSLRSTGGAYVTIDGGAGNDTVTGSASAEVFRFRAEDDHDVITNFSTNDTLAITDGSLQSCVVDEDDLLISVEGKNDSGSVRLLNAADIPIKVVSGTGSLQTLNNDTIKDIFNRKRNKTVSGSKNRDYIFNYARNVTVNAGASNDTIANYGERVSLQGGEGDDSIKNLSGAYVTLHGGNGNDTLGGSDSAEVFEFHADGGNDIIDNFSATYDTLAIRESELSYCYVDANDLIVVVQDENNVGTVRLKNHADSTIKLLRSNSAIESIKAFNYIPNTRSSTIVNGTSGADYISNSGSNVTINAEAGNDRIYSRSSSNSINAGAGNDSIYGTYSYSTVNAGTGNDTIAGGSGNNVYQFRADDGNDLIMNFASSDRIQLTSEMSASHYFDNDDVILNFEQNDQNVGSVILKNTVNIPIKVWHANGIIATINNHNDIINGNNNTLISGTDARDSIYNSVADVTIEAGASNDTVANNAHTTKILGGAGNDSIRSYNRSTIDGGEGNDIINGNGSEQSIFGGDGDDYIYNFKYSTVRGGDGFDTIEGAGNNVYQIGSTDGRALIKNFSSSDTLQIIDGSIKSHFTSGDDYVVKVRSKTASAIVTLVGASNTLIKVLDAEDSLGAFGYDIANWTEDKSLSGTASLDLIFNAGDYVTINALGGNDLIDSGSAKNVSINGGAGNDSVRVYQYSTVTGGAGNDTVTSSSTIGHNVYQFRSDGGRDLITNFSQYDTLYITAGASISHRFSDDDCIVSVKGARYSGAITLGGIASDPLAPIFVRNINGKTSAINYAVYNSESNTMLSGTSNADKIFNEGIRVTLNAGAGNDTIRNIADYAVIDGGAGNDSIYGYDLDYGSLAGGRGHDTVHGSFRHSTICGGAGNDYISITGSNNVYSFGSTDGNDIISGFTSSDTLKLTSGSILAHSLKGEDYIVSVGDASTSAVVTLRGTAWTTIYVSDTLDAVSTLNSFNVLSNSTGSTLVVGTNGRDSIYNNGSRVTIQSGAGNDAIFNISNYARIDAGAGDDSVRSYQYATVDGGSGNDSINAYYSSYYNKYQSLNGGAGDDSIYNFQYSTVLGGAGNDTLEAYAGHNLYRFGAGGGNDVVTNFVANYDTIAITDGTISAHYRSGSDYVLEVGDSASMILKGAGNDSIKIRNADGSNETLRATGSFEMPLDAADYWFEQDEPSVESPLEKIIQSDVSIDLQFDQLTETFRPQIELASSARKKNRRCL